MQEIRRVSELPVWSPSLMYIFPEGLWIIHFCKIISGFFVVSGKVQTSIISPSNMAAESAAQVAFFFSDKYFC